MLLPLIPSLPRQGSIGDKTAVSLQGTAGAPPRLPPEHLREGLCPPSTGTGAAGTPLGWMAGVCVPFEIPCTQPCQRGQPLPKNLGGHASGSGGVRNEARLTEHQLTASTSGMGCPESVLHPWSSPGSSKMKFGVRVTPDRAGAGGGRKGFVSSGFYFPFLCTMPYVML